MECRLHLGAHRTGTTSAQKLLETRHRKLREGGVVFLGPKELRGWGLFETLSKLMEGRADPHEAEAKRNVLADHINSGGAVKRLVISDENLTGSLHLNYDSASLYPEAAARLAALAEVLPLPPDVVCFTIRDFAGLWKSAHAHLAFRHKAGTFDADHLASSAGNTWLPVLQAIRATFPAARFRVLGYDETIVSRVVGTLVGPELAASLPKERRTFGLALNEDVAAQLKDILPGPERERLALELRSKRDLTERAFSSDQMQVLAQAYARDWDDLRAGAVAGAELDPGQTGTVA